MRSARTLVATAAASAVLVLGAPGAYASGGWDEADSSYSKEQEKGQENGTDGTARQDDASGAPKQDPAAGAPKQEGNSWSGKQDTGSGTVKQDEGSWGGKQDEESWGGGHEKPRGGVHTGGGGLASPAVTAGGLAVLAVAGTGLYAVRRRKTAGSVA
ncbi:hypothetical protein [Streptomyces griseiscabiei]|uniref:Integral membrane protein n=1 Tax=Streptomyces griseiscabiei TaxID=2993540 RepID=A0ABU4LDA2_9ACTN|nr:hypothetical protein [Streptomyces griseiscabiei]MBZ3906687.1 hypothetical protein [Streptomyces griseiscabiei]MDX2913752.1 hypothetical protein [Streptomyces griseiscabiei]